MTIEQTDVDCPDCGTNLQVIYVTELKQSISGWACPNCGYVASNRDGSEESVDVTEKEYLIRVEKPLKASDTRRPSMSVTEEFRARAEGSSSDELWLLIDPDSDAVVGDDVPDRG
jgi:rubredoxin